MTAPSHTDATYDKPLPAMSGLTKEFYDWCRRGELRFQRCSRCHAWRHVPRELCADCGSWEWTWEPSSGRGRVFTWTVVVRAMHPAFQHEAPYAVAVVELEEGVRIVSQVIDCPPEELEIDLPVAVRFQDVTPEVTLPVFERASS
jgi:uncharacterized OB-fold protein